VIFKFEKTLLTEVTPEIIWPEDLHV